MLRLPRRARKAEAGHESARSAAALSRILEGRRFDAAGALGLDRLQDVLEPVNTLDQQQQRLPAVFLRCRVEVEELLRIPNAPLIDLRQLLDGEPSVVSRSSRFMVLNSEEIPAGFLVDSVSGYRRFASHEQRNDLVTKQSANWQEFLLGSFVRDQQAYLVFSFMKLALADVFQNASA